VAILPIVKYPDDILKQQASSVKRITKDIFNLVDDMAETMYEAQGVGLAAPQIGRSLRLIVLDPTGKEAKQLITLVNPQITFGEGEIEDEEGCLSLPGVICKVKRFAKIRIKGIDPIKGKEVEIEAEDFLARIFQHEIDHLNGKLIWDRLGMLKREFYKHRYKQKKTKL